MEDISKYTPIPADKIDELKALKLRTDDAIERFALEFLNKYGKRGDDGLRYFILKEQGDNNLFSISFFGMTKGKKFFRREDGTRFKRDITELPDSACKPEEHPCDAYTIVERLEETFRRTPPPVDAEVVLEFKKKYRDFVDPIVKKLDEILTFAPHPDISEKHPSIAAAYHRINGKSIEVLKYTPKDQTDNVYYTVSNDSPGRRPYDVTDRLCSLAMSIALKGRRVPMQGSGAMGMS